MMPSRRSSRPLPADARRVRPGPRARGPLASRRSSRCCRPPPQGTEMRRAWSLVARHRGYRLLLTAGLVSLAGDWVLSVGLTYQVYRLTGSTLASGTMLLAWWLPQILLGFVAGVLADRWDRRLTMVTADMLLAAGLLPLLLVHGASQVWIVYLVAFWEGAIGQFFTPAQAASVPHLVDADELTAANGAYGQAQNVARRAASAIGGVVAASGGLTAIALSDAASFLISAALLTRIHGYGTAPPVAQGDRRSLRKFQTAWTAGIRMCAHDPVLRLMIVFISVTGVGEGINLTLLAPFVSRVLHGDARAYGTILALQAVGGIAGGILIAAYGHRLPARTPPALQVQAGDGHRGRVFGAFATVQAVAILLGIVAGGGLGSAIGIIPVLAAQGAGYCGTGLFLTVALRARRESGHYSQHATTR